MSLETEITPNVRPRIRKIYIVPNIVTTGNMFCGFYSIIASMHGDFAPASWSILGATVFDALDGRIARMAKATSKFGVEYDSLSDLVSFGLAPAILLYRTALEPFDRLGWIAAFFYVVCGALRLARFNALVDDAPKGFFQGLPIPAAAGMVSSTMIFVGYFELEWLKTAMVIVLTLGISVLMVSTIRFPSFKEVNWRARASFGYLVLGVVAMVSIAVKPEVMLFLVGAAYVLSSLAWNVWTLSRKPNAVKAPMS